MHTNQYMIEEMINSNSIIIPHFDTLSWKNLWQNYMASAYRFTRKEKLDLLGDEEIIIRTPDFKNLTEFDKRLVGEFLRRNHPRIAHEIALKGLLMKDKKILQIEDLLEDPIKDLSGFIARSHGIDLRNTFNYLKLKYSDSWKNPFNIKIIYLMAILRIADYIQIHSSRAPKLILNIKRFLSPYSKAEWNVHNSIQFINTLTDDPEKIYVHCIPNNCSSYLKLEKLFLAIQKELDTTWAILGEVYGNSQYEQLKLKYRRLKSNIEDKETLKKQVNFIPEEIKFRTDPNILKLLVKPLYNNDPSSGIRELLQNALDACHERKVKDNNYSPKINIKLKRDQNEFFLSIEDNGIGMNSKILINHYFKAGDSFRNSKEWLSSFSEYGNSKVKRTGKFGIGVLATFLLGNEFTLETKHLNSNQGYKIETNLTSDQIEILKTGKKDVGTIIQIKLSSELSQHLLEILEKEDFEKMKLKWFNWFLGDVDFISYEIDASLEKLFDFLDKDDKEPYFPQENLKWREFKTKEGSLIYWTFEKANVNQKLRKARRGVITCNGFIIKNGYNLNLRNYPWTYPRISILDKNGIIPLSLDRNSIYNNLLPFENSLIENIAKDIVATLLSLKLVNYGDLKFISNNVTFKNDLDFRKQIYCNKNGYFLNEFNICKKLNIENAWHIWITKKSQIPFDNLFKDGNEAYQIFRNGEKVDVTLDPLTFYNTHKNDQKDLLFWFSPGNEIGAAKSLGKKILYFTGNDVRKSYDLVNSMPEKKLIKGMGRELLTQNLKNSERNLFYVNNLDLLDPSRINIPFIKNNKDFFNSIYQSKFSLNYNQLDFEDFKKIILHYLEGQPIIPFDFEKRKLIYKKAFNDFGSQIEKYFNNG